MISNFPYYGMFRLFLIVRKASERSVCISMSTPRAYERRPRKVNNGLYFNWFLLFILCKCGFPVSEKGNFNYVINYPVGNY